MKIDPHVLRDPEVRIALDNAAEVIAATVVLASPDAPRNFEANLKRELVYGVMVPALLDATADGRW